MYTIDASVWVNSFDQQEAGHEISRRLLTIIGRQGTPLFAPTLALAEVSGAISRTRKEPTQAEAFALAMSKLPNLTLIAVDQTVAEQAASLAAQHGLRGADAVYAAIAADTNSILISLDKEHLSRLQAQTPSNVLIALAEDS